jgi:hypothetical protein
LHIRFGETAILQGAGIIFVESVQLISKLSSIAQKVKGRFIKVFSTCQNAFLKLERQIFLYRLGKFDNIKCR